MTATTNAIRPTTAADLARALREASEARRSVRVRGAGTKDYLGDLEPTDLTVETAGFSGIVAHVPADLTVTVRAGTKLADLRTTLAGAGQMLALDPPHASDATIGGVVAANSSGFWRARYGGVRDQLLGIVFALADGSVARAGGRVVKNVAGYDLNKLFIGSLGTLGVLTECTFKVLPIPQATAGAALRFRRPADVFAAADRFTRISARPAALVAHATSRDAWDLYLQADGAPTAVERTLELANDTELGTRAERLDDVAAALAPLRELPVQREGAIVRASLPPAAQASFADAAVHLDAFTRFVSDAASGVVRVHLRGLDDDIVAGTDALLAAARVCGGSARVERRPAQLRMRIAAWGDGDLPGLFLMRRLKAAFDPNGVLEPGRGPVR